MEWLRWYSGGLDGCGIGVRFLAGAVNFSLIHGIQTASWAFPASNTMRFGSFLAGIKAAGTSSIEVRNDGANLHSATHLHDVTFNLMQRQLLSVYCFVIHPFQFINLLPFNGMHSELLATP
jgi:hypothetical protein